MSFFSWLRHRPANRALFRPRLEGLEDRALPSTTLTVSSLADSGKDTLRSAIQTADQHPDKTYTINISVAGAISLKSSLPDLAGDITINGQDTIHTLIQRDALAAPFRIVTVGGGFKATLSKLAIAQGNAGSGNGGAIDNRGTLILTDCSLNSNSAAIGGAVENEPGASLTATGTAFSTNVAINGGGIDNNGDLMVGGNCNFINNSATNPTILDYGGGINNNGTGTAQVIDSTFTNNECDNHGGGIFNGAGHTLVVTNCAFRINHTLVNALGGIAYNGGGIENAGTLTVASSTFDHNYANTTYGSGGAISNFGNATLSQTAFTNNSGVDAGAIINWGGASLTLGAGTTFDHNSATYSGGAMWNYGTVVDNGASYTNNSAVYGGAIINFATVTMSGGSFSNNQTTHGDGGAIWNIGSLSNSGTSFTSNTALHGGAISNYFDATVSGCTFDSNHATAIDTLYLSGGGAIWNDWSLTVQNHCRFLGNTSVNSGGAISNFSSGANATVSQSTFFSNSTQVYGGAIDNDFGCTLTLNAGCTFTNNQSPASGGAIVNLGTLNATGATFTNNSATGSFATGGAVDNYAGAANLTGCSFSYNTAAFGGALDNSFGSMTLSGCQLIFNSAQYGGGIANASGVLNVVAGCAIESNQAAVNGGGIYTARAGTTNILDSMVAYNTGVSNIPNDTHTVTSDGSMLNVNATSIVPYQTWS